MKKILITLFVFSILIIIPTSSYAADLCPGNAAPELQQSDPACYTSVTSTSTSTWRTYERIGRHFVSNGCRWYVDCRNCSYPCNSRRGGACRATFYTNTCGGRWCSNMGSPPVQGHWVNDYGWVPHSRTSTSTSTSYTCYKRKVSDWTECSTVTGLQYASDFELEIISGSTTCSNDTVATFQSCPACGSANSVPSGVAPSSGLCAASNTASTPSITGINWNWTCTVDSQSVNCSAPNEQDGQCNSTHNNATWDSVPSPQSELCSEGTVSNFSAVTSNGPWTWDCDPIGSNGTHTTKHCNANCFDFTANINPNPFPWPTNGIDDATVEISVTPSGMCSADYSCEANGQAFSITGGSATFDISQGSSGISIPVECTRIDGRDINGPDTDGDGTPDGDGVSGDPVSHNTATATGYCTASECNAQGSCQATPVPSTTGNGSACTSTCNSNADCSSGRIIETRP